MASKDKGDMDMKVHLRGCLWRPGVNGLGAGEIWANRLLPCRERFDAAARLHDGAYDRGDGAWERRAADIDFLYNCLRRCDTDWHVAVAVAYYWAVRLLGWLFYRYGQDRQKGKKRQKARKERHVHENGA